MIGEAREFGKRYTCLDELAPLWDESTKRVSQHLRELAHEAVQEKALVQGPAHPKNHVEPEVPVEEAEHLAVNITNLSATDSFLGEDMMTRKTMTIDRFVPGAWQAIQPPPFSSWTSSEKAEGRRSATHGSGRCSHSNSSLANRRYRHSRAANLGRVGCCVLLSSCAGVEA